MLNLHPSFNCYWDCKPNFNFSDDRKPNFNCYWCCKPNFNFSVNCKPNSNLSRNWKPQFYKNFLIMSLLLASDALKTWQCKLIFNQNLPGYRLDNVYQFLTKIYQDTIWTNNQTKIILRYCNQSEIISGYNLNHQSSRLFFNQSEIVSGYKFEPSINPRLF